jgi:hypothetical protein
MNEIDIQFPQGKITREEAEMLIAQIQAKLAEPDKPKMRMLTNDVRCDGEKVEIHSMINGWRAIGPSLTAHSLALKLWAVTEPRRVERDADGFVRLSERYRRDGERVQFLFRDGWKASLVDHNDNLCLHYYRDLMKWAGEEEKSNA